MYVLCMLVFPLMVTFLFTSLMDEGQPENMPVGIVDQDNTTFTRKLTHSLDAFQTTRIVARYASFEEARQAMQHGDIYAFLYFPEGTTDALLSSRRPTISFYYTYTSLTAGHVTGQRAHARTDSYVPATHKGGPAHGLKPVGQL